MTKLLSTFEAGKFGDHLKSKLSILWNWASGKKPKVNPDLRKRLQEMQAKYAKEV